MTIKNSTYSDVNRRVRRELNPRPSGLKVRCSSLTELRTRTLFVEADRKTQGGFLVFLFQKR